MTYKATVGSPPVAIVVVSVCVVSNALCVITKKRAINTCVCLHPTGLRGNSMMLHTFVNLGLSAAATQKHIVCSVSKSTNDVFVFCAPGK